MFEAIERVKQQQDQQIKELLENEAYKFEKEKKEMTASLEEAKAKLDHLIASHKKLEEELEAQGIIN